MGKEFCLGLAIGLIGGAIFVSNSKKLRNIILEGQSKVVEKMNKNQEERSTETSYT